MARLQKNLQRSDCPINYALEILGDKWSLLILRDMVFWGKKTYGEFLRSDEHIATNILGDRLLWLEREQLISRMPDPTDKRRDIFTLTEKGLGLIPLLVEVALWSHTFGPTQLLSNEQFLAELNANKDAMVDALTEEVRNGGFVFSKKEWQPCVPEPALASAMAEGIKDGE